MTSQRIDIFSQTETQSDLSRFTPKGRAGEGQPSAADLAALPEGGKFVSREVPQRQPKKPVRVISDRQEQFNSRVSAQTRRGYEDLSLRLNLPRGEVLARALRALQRELDDGHERHSGGDRHDRHALLAKSLDER